MIYVDVCRYDAVLAQNTNTIDVRAKRPCKISVVTNNSPNINLYHDIIFRTVTPRLANMPQNDKKNNVIKIISGSKGQYPIKLGIIPNQLAISIHLQYITVGGKSVPCWSYVSEGLISLKRKEVTFTLQAGEGEDTNKFPTQPLQLFLLIYKYASQKAIDSGDVIKLGDKGLFGFPALAFLFPLIQIPNVAFNRPTLSAILLTEAEYVTAHTYGLTRVIARLGYEQKRYPCFAANARNRTSLNWQSIIQKSVLKNMRRMPLKQASVYMFGGDHVVLDLPVAARGALANAFKNHPGNKPLNLLLQLQPQHEGCLVWLPDSGATEMHMRLNTSGESIAGSFIQLIPGQAHCGAVILEDGFVMQFTTEDWLSFIDAVAGGRFLQIHGSDGGMDFILSWGNQPIVTGESNESDGGTKGGVFKKLLKKFKK